MSVSRDLPSARASAQVARSCAVEMPDPADHAQDGLPSVTSFGARVPACRGGLHVRRKRGVGHGQHVVAEHVAARVRGGDGVRGRRGEFGVLQADRGEQPVPEDLRQRLAVELLGDQAEQDEVGVRVVIALPGREVRRMRERQRQQLLRRPHLLRVPVEGLVQLERLAVVEQPAAHVQQLLDRDAVAAGDLGPVFRDRVLEGELALLHQLQDHRSRPGLGVRADPDVVVEGHRRTAVAFGRAVGDGLLTLRGA